jgi:hypothetical protein
MVDKLIKLTRIGKYRHNNNKGLMLNILPIKTVNLKIKRETTVSVGTMVDQNSSLGNIVM